MVCFGALIVRVVSNGQNDAGDPTVCDAAAGLLAAAKSSALRFQPQAMGPLGIGKIAVLFAPGAGLRPNRDGGSAWKIGRALRAIAFRHTGLQRIPVLCAVPLESRLAAEPC